MLADQTVELLPARTTMKGRRNGGFTFIFAPTVITQTNLNFQVGLVNVNHQANVVR
jgi:hypothetical protein